MSILRRVDCASLRKPARGFTLIELLVVIAIIALLVSILMPSLAKAKEIAKSAACLANLRNMHPALFIYMSNNNESLPAWGWKNYKAQPTDPNPAVTAWYLEMHRTMGANDTQFPDLNAVKADVKAWTRANPILICPLDNRDIDEWGNNHPNGSYFPPYYTWAYYASPKDSVSVFSNKQEYCNFGKIRKAAETMMFTESLPHGWGEAMDGTSQLANTLEPWYVSTIPLSIRKHPGAGKTPSGNGARSWEGTNTYLFFDGHATLRHLPPYNIGNNNSDPNGTYDANLPFIRLLNYTTFVN